MDIVINLARKIATLAGYDPAGREVDKIIEMLIKKYGLRRFYVYTMSSDVFLKKPRPFAVKALVENRLKLPSR